MKKINMEVYAILLLSLLFCFILEFSCSPASVSVTQNKKEISQSCVTNQFLINNTCYDTCSVTHPCAFGFVCDVYSSPMLCKSSSQNSASPNYNHNSNNTISDDSDTISDFPSKDDTEFVWQSQDVNNSNNNVDNNQNHTNNTNHNNDNNQLPVSQDAIKVSNSKLGFHVLGNPNLPEVITIQNSCPKIMKYLNGLDAQRIKDYKTKCQNGVVVFRVWIPNEQLGYSASDDPNAKAQQYWNSISPHLSGLGTQYIDWLEGPNELDGILNWYGDYNNATWFANFWSKLADIMNDNGYHPLVASIAVGNPALNNEIAQGVKCAMCPLADVMKSKSYPIAWGYHGYTKDLTYDVNTELWMSLRYRWIRDQCGLQGVPIVVSEGGKDLPSWIEAGLSSASYFDWLKWYDQQIQSDSEVIGVTLFQIGGGTTDWQNFNLEPLANDVSNYISSMRP